MQQEIQALEDNNTWTVCPLPPQKRALGCKWVYKIKYHANGTIERFKARLVILGNHQIEGIDYNETFAPVAKMVTVRIILAVAAAKHWELHQMDVHNAFLHGGLANGELLANPDRYRRLVGRLIYLCFTRPELSYCVHVLSQFMQQPRTEHWEAALRVVRYLKSNPGQGVLLDSRCDLQLSGWCDSDWAACPLTRKSLTGWIVFLGHSPISWKTKKQNTVARSSAEAEYRSMASTTCELKWIKSVLSNLGVTHSMPIQLYCDNQAALHIAKNPVFHERTKHIDVDCHFIRDEIVCQNLQPSYVPTRTQLADTFTKALGRT